MIDKFSCHMFQRCSDKGYCISTKEKSMACNYNTRHLSQGRNFYSEKKVEIEKRLYIDCFDRIFHIGKRNEVGLTYKLNDNYVEIENMLKSHSIPYVTKELKEKCILEGTKQEPANSLIVIKYKENKYNVGNYNSCLMLKFYADKICKALNKKGISAKVETRGKKNYKRPPKKRVDPLPDIHVKEKNTQVTIFDLMQKEKTS